jgi:hypothetical protein
VPETSPKTRVERPKFDGERAWNYIKKQCDFGPRALGMPGHEKTKDYLVEELKKYADKVLTQEFTYRKMPVTNIAGIFYPAGAKEPSTAPILLAAHWDTRPIADGPRSAEARRNPPFQYGPKGWNRLSPIPGANDGASGVAVLLELARLFKQQKPTVGVVILFVDGEDYGDFQANNGEGDGVFLGSRYFAQNYRKTLEYGQPFYGILLDIVGGKDLIIPREEAFSPPEINEKVFRIAQTLGYGNIFRFDESHQVLDDHVPLNQAGIPTADLIHPIPFGQYESRGYIYWHTLSDTPDKCSSKSLKAVGETVAEVIYREK